MELTKLNIELPKEKGAFQTTAILRGEEAAVEAVVGAVVGAIVTNRIAGQTMSKLRRTFYQPPVGGKTGESMEMAATPGHNQTANGGGGESPACGKSNGVQQIKAIPPLLSICIVYVRVKVTTKEINLSCTFSPLI